MYTWSYKRISTCTGKTTGVKGRGWRWEGKNGRGLEGREWEAEVTVILGLLFRLWVICWCPERQFQSDAGLDMRLTENCCIWNDRWRDLSQDVGKWAVEWLGGSGWVIGRSMMLNQLNTWGSCCSVYFRVWMVRISRFNKTRSPSDIVPYHGTRRWYFEYDKSKQQAQNAYHNV